MKNVVIIIGTRPEAIKLWPIINLLKHESTLNTSIINTGQHGKMLDETMLDLGIKAKANLRVMRPGQSLPSLLARLVNALEKQFKSLSPDLVVVQGDTLTALSASIVGFLMRIKIAHVEAGLRTNNIGSPFPEEFSRQVISRVADIHFAPTTHAKENLIKEGIHANLIEVTGNTIVDATLMSQQAALEFSGNQQTINLSGYGEFLCSSDSGFALVTLHRRENAGSFFEIILKSIALASKKNPNFRFVFPVHPNPSIRVVAHEILGQLENVILIQPQKYSIFMRLLQSCNFVLSDSGGLQEEAVTLGKTILVARNDTERPEGLASGYMKMVSGNEFQVSNTLDEIIKKSHRQSSYNLAPLANPFGDGRASSRIVERIKKELFAAL